MQDTPTPVRVRHFWRALAIWVAVTAVMIAALVLLTPYLIDWRVLPVGASDRSGEINNVLWLFTLLSIPVFTFVVVFALYNVFAHGGRGRPLARGPVVLVSPRFQALWLLVSVLLVVFLYVYGLAFLQQVSAQPTGDVLQVNVTGEQWLWNYSYPQYGDISGTQLYLPVNRPVMFNIQSIDVQHSFWIPSFGIKQDAVPGETTHISVTPNTIGDYVVRCAELCGLYHAYMDTPVHVVSQADFDKWINSQPTPAPIPSPAESSGFSAPDIALVGSGSASAGFAREG